MRHRIILIAVFSFAAIMGSDFIAPASARAQAAPPKTAKAPKDTTKKKNDDEKKPSKPPAPPLFMSEAPVAMTLTTNLKALKKDRPGSAPYRPGTISYVDSAGATVTVPVRVRGRGLWRFRNCEFPPVRLNFKGKETKKTLFHDLDEPKLVSYCFNKDAYEQYVLQEFQLYRVYHLLTPVSHQVRLIKMTYVDSATSKVEATRYAFISEDPAMLARRVNGTMLDQQGAGPQDMVPEQAAVAFMFQYLIGNTDFSFRALHNGEIIRWSDGRHSPIAYDFDWSGAVNTTYAIPDKSLPTKTVRERLFRGWCALNPEYVKTVPMFQEKQADIYRLYADPIAQLLPVKVLKQTLDYFGEFYQTIGNARSLKTMLEDCVGPK